MFQSTLEITSLGLIHVIWIMDVSLHCSHSRYKRQPLNCWELLVRDTIWGTFSSWRRRPTLGNVIYGNCTATVQLWLKLFQFISLYSLVGHCGVVNQSLPAGLRFDTCALVFNCSLFMIRTGGSCVKDMFQRWESCRQSKRSRLNPWSSRVCCVWPTQCKKSSIGRRNIFSCWNVFIRAAWLHGSALLVGKKDPNLHYTSASHRF